MPQREAWEQEYGDPQLVSLGDEPQKDVKKFLKFLRRKEKFELSGKRVLDLGSGTGKNANYLAAMGNDVIGIEISATAVQIANQRAFEEGIKVDYRIGDMGLPYDLKTASVDLVLDVMSSNSLNESERENYLQEVQRVLKPGGYLYVRALCKDGDKNAKMLLKLSPGKEHDTYFMKEMKLTERVFSEQDFRALYEPRFEILDLEKKTNYVTFKNQKYKRNYWLATMKKKS